MSEFLQFLFAGLSSGAIYALVGIGFSIVYNASHVINFAQGEFVMIGGMGTVSLLALGWPYWLAIPAAVAAAVVVGLLLDKLAIEPARNAGVAALIIITIGASILLRGLAELIVGKQFHRLPSWSGDEPIRLGGATLHPQALWILGSLLAICAALWWFFERTRFGKAMRATAHNRLAAELMGIDVRRVLLASFALAAGLGALAGILTAPLTLTQYDAGIMLGLKGFSAAMLGGLGVVFGGVAGGLLLGLCEAMAAGYLSSAYKDIVAFVVILGVLLLRPSGLFGAAGTERA